jgi:hypothetical protein
VLINSADERKVFCTTWWFSHAFYKTDLHVRFINSTDVFIVMYDRLRFFDFVLSLPVNFLCPYHPRFANCGQHGNFSFVLAFQSQ